MQLSASAPIGIFDSGIGGLTVASAIHTLLARESIIYFGDTAHLPYGDKSPELIQSYAIEITNYLLSRGCKMIVIACNTASAHAYKTVQKHAGRKVPVINVIDPAAVAISERFKEGRVGVIGTRGTINSGIYPRKIKKMNDRLEVSSLATPLLAPMIEEGFFNNNISRTIIHSYLEKKSLYDIQAIILACTHYPLIRKEIEQYYGKKVEVFDSAEIVAREVQRRLKESGFLADETNIPYLEFYVSDYTDSFEKSVTWFFPEQIHLEKLVPGH